MDHNDAIVVHAHLVGAWLLVPDAWQMIHPMLFDKLNRDQRKYGSLDHCHIVVIMYVEEGSLLSKKTIMMLAKYYMYLFSRVG